MSHYDVRRRRNVASPEYVARYRTLPTANVSDVMGRLAGAGSRLRPMHDGSVLCGPALTVKARPGDNLMVHAALDLAAPGDIIIVDAGGVLSNAIVGELMVAHAIRRNLGGIVIDGAIRDSAAIAAGSFPVFAAGVTHRGPYRDGPGSINVSVVVGEMAVNPGDLVLGDADGLVAIPLERLDAVFAEASAKNELERKQLVAFQQGTSDRRWVQAALDRLNVSTEPE